MSHNKKPYFILNNTWNIFYYVFRIFGVYPCVRDDENGVKPRYTLCIWAHYICTYLILNATFAWIPASYIAFVETTPKEYLENLFDVAFQSNTTAIAMICNVTIYHYIGFICFLKLRNLSIGLSEFQNYYNNHTQVVLNEEKITAYLKKQHLNTLLFGLVFYSGLILLYTFLLFELKLNLNLSLVSTILNIFGTSIGTIPILMPTTYFILIYFEIIIFLSIWCDGIKNIQFDDSLIKEAKIFIDGLDLVSNIFSHFLFWIIFALLFQLVMMSYLTVAKFWDRNNFHVIQFHTMASVLHIFSYIILMYGLCTFSENVAEKVKAHYYKLINI